VPDNDAGVYAAILEVQKAVGTLPKDKTARVQTKAGGEYTYSYSALDTIVEAIRELLGEHGLVWTSKPAGTHEAPTLSYKLVCVTDGSSEAGEMPLYVGQDPTPQAMGSAITYARRYALVSVLNLVADDDDDGQAAQGHATQHRGTYKYNPQRDSGEAASPAQLKRVRGDMKKVGVKTADEFAFIAGAALQVDVPTADRLTKAQASYLIDWLSRNPVPTGKSDVPSDTEGLQEALPDGGDPVPWDDPEENKGEAT
jgi:hypothetical protein